MRGFGLKTVVAVVTALALSLVVGACASSGERSGGDSRLLTAEELEASGASDVYEAVERLRPRWLRGRGGRSLDALETDILVYFNDSRMGSPEETLRSMSLDGISRIEYLDSARASALPGTGSGHVEAAIMVYTRDQQ